MDHDRDAYRNQIDEYRFQVRLNWDRTKFFLTVDGVLLAAATGLLALRADPIVGTLVIVLFLAGAYVAEWGRRVTCTGHTYYRSIVARKTALEAALGMHEPMSGHERISAPRAIGTTPGMQRIDEILEDPDGWVERPIRRGSTTGLLMLLFRLVSAVNVGAATLLAVALVNGIWPMK